jgi:hypothetical protein
MDCARMQGVTKGISNPPNAVQQIAISACGRYLAVSFQESSNLNVYAVAQI